VVQTVFAGKLCGRRHRLERQGRRRWGVAVDVLHGAEAAVLLVSETDVATLENAGRVVTRELGLPGYRRAGAEKAGPGVKLEWCRDCAWRFFPIQPDPLLGRRLHRCDAITNKALALAGINGAPCNKCIPIKINGEELSGEGASGHAKSSDLGGEDEAGGRFGFFLLGCEVAAGGGDVERIEIWTTEGAGGHLTHR
jgi:hypothetical protein